MGRGELTNLVSTTNERSSEILADENGNLFLEKVKVKKLSMKSKKFGK